MKKTLCLLILSSCVFTYADVKVTATDASGETEMFMNSESVRINVGGGNQSVLYNVQADAFQHLNHDERSYMEFDQEMIEELSESMNAAMAQMKSVLASLPKEQQEAMAKLMGTSPVEDQPAKPEPVISKTEKTQTINGVPCELYTVTVDGELDSELWVASYKSLKIVESDVQGFRKLTAFQEKMIDSFKNNPLAKESMKSGITLFSEIDGFPLLVKSYKNGQVENEFKVDSLVNVGSDAARYGIPSGYRKQEMPNLGRAGGLGGF
jgi:hypothetical protein